MNDTEMLRIIKDTYLYGYPIVGMYELLHAQVMDANTKTSALNEFAHTAEVASPKTSFIPAPNNDTSYSRAWLDLTGAPVIIAVPDTDDRYYSIQLLNLFSETIINVGRRTTGTQAAKFAIVGPNWDGELPNDAQIIRCDTPFALAFLRILINGPQDIAAVREIQSKIVIQAPPAAGVNGLVPYKNATKAEFFETLHAVLSLTPVQKGEEVYLANCELCLHAPMALLEQGCAEALADIEKGGTTFGEACNFWRIARKGIGNYGQDYLQRAVVWHKGALANQPEESLYPSTFQDSTGALLDGTQCYTLTFAKGQLPPVSQFWSLTLYIFDNAFLYDNEIDRYSIGDRTNGLSYDEDGSLTIYLQNKAPQSAQKKANWMPVPTERFFIVLRLYGPSEAVVRGDWQPPAVQKSADC
ncbi:MAG: DUF1254 domain-containing protein [Oscillospiraceae bacterium]|nr:DUF1254 domain-containing protein [Oscillospiraceae bacterium]